MSGLAIKPATRSGIVPLIALYAESGCGKTFSSLLMARGIAGPSGKIVMIDTENGKGELYADIPAIGGYDALRLSEPFPPSRYVEAITMAEESAGVIIVDSGSHEWEGMGGVLDMAATNEDKSGKQGLHNWRAPKFEHGLFVQKLQRVKVPIIVCLRAKFKTRQGKDEKGKTVIIKDDRTSPIQADDFIFEATAHAEILPDHSINLTKCSHPALRDCFPAEGPIKVEHGQMIAKWCIGTASAIDLKAIKKTLWALRPNNCTAEQFQQWLWDELHMPIEERLETATAERIGKIIERLNK